MCAGINLRKQIDVSFDLLCSLLASLWTAFLFYLPFTELEHYLIFLRRRYIYYYEMLALESFK